MLQTFNLSSSKNEIVKQEMIIYYTIAVYGASAGGHFYPKYFSVGRR